MAPFEKSPPIRGRAPLLPGVAGSPYEAPAVLRAADRVALAFARPALRTLVAALLTCDRAVLVWAAARFVGREFRTLPDRVLPRLTKSL